MHTHTRRGHPHIHTYIHTYINTHIHSHTPPPSTHPYPNTSHPHTPQHTPHPHHDDPSLPPRPPRRAPARASFRRSPPPRTRGRRRPRGPDAPVVLGDVDAVCVSRRQDRCFWTPSYRHRHTKGGGEAANTQRAWHATRGIPPRMRAFRCYSMLLACLIRASAAFSLRATMGRRKPLYASLASTKITHDPAIKPHSQVRGA